MKVEISNGELLDKISILEIKLNNITNQDKLTNVKKEYVELLEVGEHLFKDVQLQPLYYQLKETNQQLWNVEDEIRVKEKQKIFDEEFVNLARNVYITNDKRADLKKQINLLSNSHLVEEKSYEEY